MAQQTNGSNFAKDVEEGWSQCVVAMHCLHKFLLTLVDPGISLLFYRLKKNDPGQLFLPFFCSHLIPTRDPYMKAHCTFGFGQI